MAWVDLVAPFLADPAHSAVITDFDGTLAPIVADPTSSAVLAGTTEVLDALAARYGRVGVVSGRPLTFLRERLSCSPTIALRGIYGMERPEAGEVVEEGTAESWRSVVADTADRADESFGGHGVGIERKGLSVALHFRTVPQHAAWVSEWTRHEADRSGLARHPGRMSWELVPPVAVDKGTTVLDLAADFDPVCFIGDDRGDLPAFQALDELARHGRHVLKVVVESPELPPELLATADLLVDGPEGALDLLRQMVRAGPAV